MNLRWQIQFLVGVKVSLVLLEFGIVRESLDNEQSQIAEVHLFQVKVLHRVVAEVVLGHLIEQHIAPDGVGRVHKNEVLRLVESLAEWGELFLDALGGGVVAESHRPEHAAGILAATVNLAALVDLLHNRRSGGRDVGFGITLQHFLERFLELVVVLFSNIGKRVDKHELGHEFRQRVGAHHLGVGAMHSAIVVVEIVLVGLLIHAFLHLLHVLEVFKIVGVLHGLPVLGVGKFGQNHAAVVFGLREVAVAHVHEI